MAAVSVGLSTRGQIQGRGAAHVAAARQGPQPARLARDSGKGAGGWAPTPGRGNLQLGPPRASTEHGTSVKSKEIPPLAPEHAPSKEAVPASLAEAPSSGADDDSSAIGQGSALLGLLVVAALVGIAAGGYVYKDQINDVIDYFSAYIEDAGPLGYAAFLFGYAGLEVLAIPAIPLTMSAGLLFGPTVGTVLCSLSASLAATVSFLIARYVARERILGLVKSNKKFLAIDKALGEDSFRVVTLLRLSPLLPFSLGNYVYGLTSIKLAPYVLGSWIGMIPGTWAYVSAGAFGRTLLEADEAGVSVSDSSVWPLLAGLVVTIAAATYVTNLAKNAMKDAE